MSIVELITAIGGATGITAILGWLLSVKSQKRKANAEAVVAEVNALKERESVFKERETYLNSQLAEKAARIKTLEDENAKDRDDYAANQAKLLADIAELREQISAQSVDLGRLREDNKCLRAQVEDVKKSLDKWRCWKAKTCPDREPPNK